MKLKIYALRSPHGAASDFSFDPDSVSGGVAADDRPSIHALEPVVHAVVVPDGSRHVKSDSGQDRLETPDGRLYSANAIAWYASRKSNGFAYVE